MAGYIRCIRGVHGGTLQRARGAFLGARVYVHRLARHGGDRPLEPEQRGAHDGRGPVQEQITVLTRGIARDINYESRVHGAMSASSDILKCNDFRLKYCIHKRNCK